MATFNPSSAGGKSATLTVGGTPGGSVSVTLTGTGLRGLGDPCTVAGDCPLGSCVDGRCCATPSCGPCKICTGAAGTCAPIINAIDSDSCTGGTCDATGTCKPSGSILWARSSGAEFLYSSIQGPSGVVTIGTIDTPMTVNLGGSTLTPVGATDSVLGQFTVADATHVSSSRFGGSTPVGTGLMYATGGLFDSTGGLIVRGVSYCDTTATVPCTQINYGLGLTSPGGGVGADGFVGRYSLTTGAPSWLATLTGSNDDKITAAVNGPAGTIFVSGWYSEGIGLGSTLTSGTNVLQFAGAGDRDILIFQVNPSTGVIGMTKTFAGPGFEEPDTMAWTGSELVVAGFFASTATDFGVRTLSSMPGFDIWVAKLNPTNGAAVWAVPLGTPGDDKYPYLVVDSVGDIYVTGFVGAAGAFGGFPVGGAGGLDIFVAKLRNVDGSVVWAKSFGSAGDDTPSGIAISPSGQLVVVGTVAGPLEPGGPASGGSDAVIASFRSDGTRLWTNVIGTGGADFGEGIASGANAFYAAIDFGAPFGATIEGTPILGAPSPKGLLLKIQP